MATKTERFDADGNRVSVQWYDDSGQPITEAAATTALTNADTIRQRAAAALQANAAFIAQAKPGTAAAQASAAYDFCVLSAKEHTALIRLFLGQLDSTSGT